MASASNPPSSILIRLPSPLSANTSLSQGSSKILTYEIRPSRAEEGVPPGEGSCDEASPAPAATAVPADIARLAVQISALASSDRAKAPEILPLQGSSDLCRAPQICYSPEKGSPSSRHLRH